MSYRSFLSLSFRLPVLVRRVVWLQGAGAKHQRLRRIGDRDRRQRQSGPAGRERTGTGGSNSGTGRRNHPHRAPAAAAPAALAATAGGGSAGHGRQRHPAPAAQPGQDGLRVAATDPLPYTGGYTPTRRTGQRRCRWRTSMSDAERAQQMSGLPQIGHGQLQRLQAGGQHHAQHPRLLLPRRTARREPERQRRRQVGLLDGLPGRDRARRRVRRSSSRTRSARRSATRCSPRATR